MKKIVAHLSQGFITSNQKEAYALQKKSQFGEKFEDKIRYTFSEALFLSEIKKMEIVSQSKKIPSKELLAKLKKHDKKILEKYLVYKDLRKKGYLPKTALKFGADFRIYDKGAKPGKTHAKWIVFIDNETKKFAWNEFTSKTRVAHSTRKKLLLAIIDEENKITYFEVGWIKP